MTVAEEIAALRSEMADFRDREFKGMADRNDKAHDLLTAEVKRINGDVGGLKVWRARLEGAASGGKALWIVVAGAAGPATAVVMKLLER
jgi:hypothetical protein